MVQCGVVRIMLAKLTITMPSIVQDAQTLGNERTHKQRISTLYVWVCVL